jgi:hypothetical protein
MGAHGLQLLLARTSGLKLGFSFTIWEQSGFQSLQPPSAVGMLPTSAFARVVNFWPIVATKSVTSRCASQNGGLPGVVDVTLSTANSSSDAVRSDCPAYGILWHGRTCKIVTARGCNNTTAPRPARVVPLNWGFHEERGTMYHCRLSIT